MKELNRRNIILRYLCFLTVDGGNNDASVEDHSATEDAGNDNTPTA